MGTARSDEQAPLSPPGQGGPASPLDTLAPQPAAKAPPRNDEQPLARRLRHVQEELAQRWRRADRVLIECYLRDFPELRADDRAVLTLIVAEARLRLQRGE